ncbi:hypothetical protein BO78DRAFT_81764 [Aspergillus sclerotiicarbonarius CBS 121057]|uniref:Uncharacterized protein n=1 Tax=Aspergillus sclerotiicarbonarius (strain CBS 121057 / IBT 28362) TaxID=1448318 RepID=A0A319ECH9_ASPSB|nr:hypothetical protein BO78DRAFT_81764 [Aspergillus sclerotiicarbonarius CBS 121057]
MREIINWIGFSQLAIWWLSPSTLYLPIQGYSWLLVRAQSEPNLWNGEDRSFIGTHSPTTLHKWNNQPLSYANKKHPCWLQPGLN